MDRASNMDKLPEILSPEEQDHYISLMSQGDQSARNVLIEHNLRLVAHIARKFLTSGIEYDDLISIGSIGLIKGVDSFKPDKGSKLSTYAGMCILNEINMFLRKHRKTYRESSIDEPIATDKDGNDLSILDICPTDGSELYENLEHDVDLEFLRQSIGVLKPREARIINYRYPRDQSKGLSQRDIAKLEDTSQTYVCRIEERALVKIRKEMNRLSRTITSTGRK